MIAKLLTEFIGTFFLVLTIGLTATFELHVAALAIGSVLLSVVYMGGPISGAHYNPAISLAFLLRGRMHWLELVPYWCAQILAAVMAAFLITMLTPDSPLFFGPEPGDGFTLFSPAVWIIEILFTFALGLVVLNVATSEATVNNAYYGLAIGFVIVAGVLAGAEISGAAYNPAVGIGPNLIKGTMSDSPQALQNIALHTIGPFIGAALAVIVFRVQEDHVVSQKQR